MPDLPFEPLVATLKSGAAFTVRALRAEDRERMATAVHGLDPQTIYTRLFAHRKELTDAGLDRIMHSDAEREVVLVATIGEGAEQRIIGGGRYVLTAVQPVKRAEVAFTVEEDYQGQGVAGRLFAALADAARRHGIAVFEADVLAENPSMLRVFTRAGLPLRKRNESGVLHVEMDLAPAPGERQ